MTALPRIDLARAAAAVPEPELEERERRLVADLARLGGALVAFSGGVDSTYVAWAAFRALGGRALAVTALSSSVPAGTLEESRALATGIGIAHEVIETRETSDPRYLENAPDRCYWCKSELYTHLAAMARDRGNEVVLDGTNTDDLGDWRPGRQAAKERGVRSPLVEAGLAKADVRLLSRAAGLPTWDRPASPCLSSRVPYGMHIDAAKLAAIDRAEQGVRALGFREFRVRHLGDAARIEIAAAELERAHEPDTERAILDAVRAAGFAAASVDDRPFRSGRLNLAAGEGA